MNIASKYHNLQIKTEEDEQKVVEPINTERYAAAMKEYAPVLSKRRAGSNNSS